jgi:hypothetical protein
VLCETGQIRCPPEIEIDQSPPPPAQGQSSPRWEPVLLYLVTFAARQEAMMTDFNKADSVKWNWGNGIGTGEVVTRYTRKTTLTIKGSDVTRDASEY